MLGGLISSSSEEKRYWKNNALSISLAVTIENTLLQQGKERNAKQGKGKEEEYDRGKEQNLSAKTKGHLEIREGRRCGDRF